MSEFTHVAIGYMNDGNATIVAFGKSEIDAFNRAEKRGYKEHVTVRNIDSDWMKLVFFHTAGEEPVSTVTIQVTY